MSGSSDRNTHYCLASHTFTHISKHCTASDLSCPCNQQYLAHVTWPGCQWRRTAFRENCRPVWEEISFIITFSYWQRQSHDICYSWWNTAMASFIWFLANFRHLLTPSKKTQCESYIGRIFVKKNSPILPDFEGKEIMKSPYLNNKFQQAQRKQESFFKQSFFPLWSVDKFG
jgi:hypothetical protein